MTTDFTPPEIEYLIVQGDTFRDGFFVTEYNPATDVTSSVDLTGCRIDVSIRSKMNKISTLLANVNTVDGGVVIANGDATNDYFEFVFLDTVTNAFPVKKVYMDIQVKYPNGNSFTFLKGEIDVSGQTTPAL
jgi:hypothetical protein